MNILFISKIDGSPWRGPSYSVPNQIKAQSEYDNVFWYNLLESTGAEWENLPEFHNLNDYHEGKISLLPEPFCNPDLVVVEQFYGYATNMILLELLRGEYKYIIIPRGELTQSAQAQKPCKKRICNFLLFTAFAKKAKAIQYLTEQEKIESTKNWNKNSLVIPNGINMPSIINEGGKNNRLKLVYIGRLAPYQKGLDLLIEAVLYVKDILIDFCNIDIYGTNLNGKRSELVTTVKEKGLDSIIRFHDGVFGSEKNEILLSSDVFLMPSRFEGHPMALVEALSFGLPCIATTGSNMRNEVESYDAGWCADNDAKSIANALMRMIEDRKKITEKRVNAIALAKKYDWRRIAKITHDEYKQLI